MRVLRSPRAIGARAPFAVILAIISGAIGGAPAAAVERHLAPESPPALTQADPEASPFSYVGQVELVPPRGVAGTEVAISGSGFDPGDDLEIAWTSVVGRWLLEGLAQESFMGREFTPTRHPVASAVVGTDGTFTASFVAPVDFGFTHDVTVERDGQLLNKAGFRLEPTVTVSPAAGPVGTPIRIRMEGVGWANLENSWMLTYDNRFTGLLSAVTSRGVAEAVIPATGAPGPHRLRIVHGAFTVPYLNGQQSPRPDRSDYVFDFMLTEGDPVMPPPAGAQVLPLEAGEPPDHDGPAIWTDVAIGPVDSPMAIHGQGLPAGAEAQLRWSTVVGNRVSGDGWQEVVLDLATVSVAEDGTFVLPSSVPSDLGGPHRLLAEVDGVLLAETVVTISPSLVSAESVSAPYGEEIELRLKGVGWTETANIYNLVYDNGYLGYACGFNSQGDVTIRLPVTGAPGWHYVDLYPGIYKGKDVPGVQNFRIPQLTYAADHPGERLPAFRVAVEVLGETAHASLD